MTIDFNLNGKPVSLSEAPSDRTLLTWLRDGIDGHCGTKEGCAEGDCGACSVVISDYNPQGNATWRVVNSCILFLPALHGREVITVEGLGTSKCTLHPVQEAMVDTNGSQCGYCTPGFIMTLAEAAHRQDLNETWKFHDQLSGNLCRCTGYRPIRDSLKIVAGTAPNDIFKKRLSEAPDELAPLEHHSEQSSFWRPTTLDSLLSLKAAHPNALLLSGGTDLGLLKTKRHQDLPQLIATEGVPELRKLKESEDGLTVGAAVSLSDLEEALDTSWNPLARMLRFFGSRQIKHRATVGGNLCNASPIGDLAPVLLAYDATVTIAGAQHGSRTLPLSSFFEDYRKTALRPEEVLISIHIPRIDSQTRMSSYKLSRRREMDISAVSAGLRVSLDSDDRIETLRLCFGGIGATPVRLENIENTFIGAPWSEESSLAIADAVDRAIQPISDHRASESYRRRLVKNFITGFYFETQTVSQPLLSQNPSSSFDEAQL